MRSPSPSSAVRICLITPGHIASTPRLVKAADSLHAAGYEVHVVASDHYAPVRPLDATILATAKWRCHRLPPPSLVGRQISRIKRRGAFQLLSRGQRSPVLAALALYPECGALRRLASAVRAHLYIGHTLGGLAAAASAAKDTGGALGFDAEDWHREEIADEFLAPGEKAARTIMEETFIPRCRHLTAASPLIADAYAPLWRRRPPVILNVFPLSEAPAAAPADDRRSQSLYWFSQTIGPGRGLEAVLAALPSAWTLDLRGHPSPGYAEQLGSLPGGNSIRWLDAAPPAEMVRLSAPHRIGLGVELRVPRNRDICLTNKLFTYLLAGTPVLLSDTAAHRQIAPDLGAAAAVVELGRPAEISAAIRALDRPEARAAAWALGQSRYNWDREQEFLLEAVRQALVQPPV